MDIGRGYNRVCPYGPRSRPSKEFEGHSPAGLQIHVLSIVSATVLNFFLGFVDLKAASETRKDPQKCEFYHQNINILKK